MGAELLRSTSARGGLVDLVARSAVARARDRAARSAQVRAL